MRWNQNAWPKEESAGGNKCIDISMDMPWHTCILVWIQLQHQPDRLLQEQRAPHSYTTSVPAHKVAS